MNDTEMAAALRLAASIVAERFSYLDPGMPGGNRCLLGAMAEAIASPLDHHRFPDGEGGFIWGGYADGDVRSLCKAIGASLDLLDRPELRNAKDPVFRAHLFSDTSEPEMVAAILFNAAFALDGGVRHYAAEMAADIEIKR